MFEGFGWREADDAPAVGPFLGIATDGASWMHLVRKRPMAHAARTCAALVADANGVSWRPFAAPPDRSLAARTAQAARRGFETGDNSGATRTPLRDLRSRRRRPVVLVCGDTGTGKTTVGVDLAARLAVPAIELGALLRLACLHEAISGSSSNLWRWSRSGRLDFDGVGKHALAAALPRLDGHAAEVPMWTDVEAQRLADLARAEGFQELIAAIASSVANVRGAVIIGRIAEVHGGGVDRVIDLNAAPAVRARRKRHQLRRLGLGWDAHDWFTPSVDAQVHRLAAESQVLDTTGLSISVLRDVVATRLPLPAAAMVRV
jgi:hypothetical protein